MLAGIVEVVSREPVWVTKTRGLILMSLIIYFAVKRLLESIEDHRHFKRLKQKNDRIGELLKQFEFMRTKGHYMPSLLDEAEELLRQVKARDST